MRSTHVVPEVKSVQMSESVRKRRRSVVVQPGKECGEKEVKVFVTSVRKKLSSGAEVPTAWEEGYYKPVGAAGSINAMVMQKST